MSSTIRWIIGVVCVVALLGAAAALRHYVSATQPAEEHVAIVRPTPHGERVKPAPRRGSVADDGEAGTGGDEVPSARHEPVTSMGQAIPAAPAKPAAGAEKSAVAAAQRRPAPAAAAGGSSGGSEAPTPLLSPALAQLAPTLSLGLDGSTLAADQTAPVLDQDVQFDPAGGAALFPPSAVLAFPDSGGIDPEQGTVAFWIDMKEPPGRNGRTLLSLTTGGWANRMNISAGPTFIGFLMGTSDGAEYGVGTSITWEAGQWHHTAVTWGDAQAVLYVDGAVRDAREYSGSFTIPPGTPLYIASRRGGWSEDDFPGTVALRSLQIFQRVLSSDEIATVIAETVPPSEGSRK